MRAKRRVLDRNGEPLHRLSYLGNEPVALERWGDAESTLDANAALGFQVVQSVSGWELDLGPR